MTLQEKKMFLGKYSTVSAELKRLSLERDRLRTRIERAGAGMDAEKLKGHLQALDADTEKRIKTLLVTRSAIYDALESVEDETLRALLRYRFLEQLSPVQVSFRLYLSQRQFYRLQNKALHALTVPEK